MLCIGGIIAFFLYFAHFEFGRDKGGRIHLVIWSSRLKVKTFLERLFFRPEIGEN